MLLRLTAARSDALADATELGFLLHKHPGRAQIFEVYGGKAVVFYPEATVESCTVCVLLDVDPISLVKGKGRLREGFALAQYVNDRPYSASSLLSTALGKVFRTALAGRCETRPELADSAIDLTIEIPAVPGGKDLVMRLFQPLGWQVDATPVALDPQFPTWGNSSYVHLQMSATVRLSAALNHLYVLLPVLDDAKHYWVGNDEVDKLIRAGEGWLGQHPERELISHRYLAHQRSMQYTALDRLDEIEGRTGEAVGDDRPRPLVALRHEAVLNAISGRAPQRVLDLGCGSGALLRGLLELPGVSTIVGTEVSDRCLQIAAKRLNVNTMTERQHDRLSLLLSSLLYQDERLTGFDVAILMEVIEHIEPDRLHTVEGNVFGFMQPEAVIVTTPNAEYNANFENLRDGGKRHPDHRFEWTRSQFGDWAQRICLAHGYDVAFRPVGALDPELGPATQLAMFTRSAKAGETSS